MAQLSAGMVFNQDVYAESVLLVAKGQEVTRTLILKLDNYYHKGEFQAGFQVSVPKPAIGSAIPSPA
jgi:hypothetical protein